jgi:hypothetical protein
MAELGSSGGCVKRRQKTERQKKLDKRKRCEYSISQTIFNFPDKVNRRQ